MNALLLVVLLAGAETRPNQGKDFSMSGRIQAHLQSTEWRLRPVPSEDPALQSKRSQLLDALHAYWIRGIFPENSDAPGTQPVFIDREGVPCAVAHLMIASGHRDLAQRIRETDNHGYLLEMQIPGLAEWIHDSGFTAEELATIQPSYDESPRGPCVDNPNKLMPRGPIALGYAEADVGAARSACPRTDLGIGARMGAIIDTPDFYGAIAVNGLLFGSYAIDRSNEVFATLEFLNFNFAQNAVITSTQITLGNATAGYTRAIKLNDRFGLGITGRLLLPTSFEIPGARLVGAEVAVSFSQRWYNFPFEVHGWLSGDVSAAVGRASALPRGGGVLTLGAEITPFQWGGLVLDLTGRLGTISYFAPAVAFRFKIGPIHIDLAGTLPVAGTDRHDFLGTLRVAYQFDSDRN